MPTKREIKKLLARKRLTAKEAARLFLQHGVELDHGRKGFLKDTEINQLHKGMSRQEVFEYKLYIDSYVAITLTIKEAEVLMLETRVHLKFPEPYIVKRIYDNIMQYTSRWTPTIVTEKQLQELKDEQRREKLEEVTTLHDLVSYRAAKIAPKNIKDFDPYFIDHYKKYPEIFREATEQILALVREGKLQLSPRDPARSKGGRDRPSTKPSDKKRVAVLLAKIKKGSLTDKEVEELETGTTIGVIGQVLYDAGLPEWRSWFEEYEPYFSESHPPHIAVLQEEKRGPDSMLVDEKGHYRPFWYTVTGEDLTDSLFSRLYGVEGQEILVAPGMDLKEIVAKNNKYISGLFCKLSSIREAIDNCSEFMEVNFREDVENNLERLKASMAYYNMLIDEFNHKVRLTDKKHSDWKFEKSLASSKKPDKTLRPDKEELEKCKKEALASLRARRLPKLKIDKLKPDPFWLSYYRERMTQYYGKNWWRSVCRGLEEAEDDKKHQKA